MIYDSHLFLGYISGTLPAVLWIVPYPKLEDNEDKTNKRYLLPLMLASGIDFVPHDCIARFACSL